MISFTIFLPGMEFPFPPTHLSLSKTLLTFRANYFSHFPRSCLPPRTQCTPGLSFQVLSEKPQPVDLPNTRFTSVTEHEKAQEPCSPVSLRPQPGLSPCSATRDSWKQEPFGDNGKPQNTNITATYLLITLSYSPQSSGVSGKK